MITAVPPSSAAKSLRAENRRAAARWDIDNKAGAAKAREVVSQATINADLAPFYVANTTLAELKGKAHLDGQTVGYVYEIARMAVEGYTAQRRPTFPTRGRKAKWQPIVANREQVRFVDLHSVPSTGNWQADNAKGRDYAATLLLNGDDVLLADVLKGIQSEKPNGVEVGFVHYVAGWALRMHIAPCQSHA